MTTLANLDGWRNILTGVGDPDRDARLSSAMAWAQLDRTTALNLWRGSDMAGRAIELPTKEMLRRPPSVLVDGDPDAGRAMDTRLDEHDLFGVVRTARNYARAFGGGAIYVAVDDGQDPKEPLRLEAIRSVWGFAALEPDELRPVLAHSDPRRPEFGKPSVYEMQRRIASNVVGSSALLPVKVHASRVIRFEGLVTTADDAATRFGWGASILERSLADVIRDFDGAFDATSALMKDFAQAVFGIKGLATILSAKDGDKVFRDRIAAIDMARSVLRATVIDADETFARTTTPVSGLPEILDRFTKRLGAAADMPVSILMGESPAGLNATGESDVRIFYDRIAGDRREAVGRPLERAVRMLFLAKDGPTKGREPERWSLKFPSLWEPTEQESAAVRKTQAEVDTAYINAGVLSAPEVAVSRFGGQTGYSTETHLVDATVEGRSGGPETDPTDEPKP